MTSSPGGTAAGSFLLAGEISIPRLGFGAMQLPGRGNSSSMDSRDAIAVVRRAVELGVRHIDTAAFYFRGVNRANDIIRVALHPYPADVTIATKVGPMRTPTGEMYAEATPAELRAGVEQNLRDLHLDALDLVYLRVGRHGRRGTEPIGERFAALAAMRDAGLIRNLGVSNVSREQLVEARAIAPIAAVQNMFSVLDQSDAALVDECAGAGIAYVPYFGLGGGRVPLTGADLAKVAEWHQATPRQVAIAWGLARSPSILQIPGTSSLAHLEENMAAGRLFLDEVDMARLANSPLDYSPLD